MNDHPLSEALREKVLARWSGAALAVVLACALAPAAVAQGTPPPEQSEQEQEQEAEEGQTEAQEQPEKFADEITVTGTRVEGRTTADTPAPVDYIDETAIRSTGATETGK